MDKKELKKILSEHKKWLEGKGGQRTNLEDANLYCANLKGASLFKANLIDADLYDANLEDIETDYSTIGIQLACPEEGEFIGWKKCKNNVLVKLLIPKDAKRSSATTRKCRASKVKVLEVIGAKEGISAHDNKTKYIEGEIIECDKWDTDRWNECSGGIHFFMNKEDAINF